MRATCLFLSVLLILSVGSLGAATINVPADQPTIQAGIDAAVDGDTVLVADGTYAGEGNRDIDFLGKAILVTSESGPESCIIDCQGDSLNPHRGFLFHSGEDTNSILDGFTLQNGFTVGLDSLGAGGAILCDSGSPLIRNNLFLNNISNYGSWAGGGAITCMFDASAVIEGNRFKGNEAIFGGAVLGFYCEPTIEGNFFIANTAESWGGGLYSQYCDVNIEDNLFAENTTVYGGAIYVGISTGTIKDNHIVGNTAPAIKNGHAGGIMCYASSMIIDGNTIAENNARHGGGVFVWQASPTMVNNTITNNTASGNNGSGGGIYVFEHCDLEILNTILWGNTAQMNGDEMTVGSSDLPSTVTIGYSNLEGGEGSIELEEGCVVNWGDGMIDSDPTCVLPDKQDYRLLWGSPCIDTGHPDSLDADGTRSDMGAYFFDQDDFLTLYITPDMTEVAPGEVLGVTYTAVNRWEQPESFWCLSQVLLPGGAALDVLGPDQYTLPASQTAQVHVNHPVPPATPAGVYEYWSRIGVLPPELYDEDSFTITVTE